MTLKKTQSLNFRGHGTTLQTLLTAIFTLLVPAADGYAQTAPAVTDNRSAKIPRDGDPSIRPFHINVPQGRTHRSQAPFGGDAMPDRRW